MNQTAFCPSCGAALPADARFCESCGFALSAAQAAAPTPPLAGSAQPTSGPIGVVIRLPDNAQPGLIVADAKQYPFTIDRSWLVDAAPALNMRVELKFDAEGRLDTIVRARGASGSAQFDQLQQTVTQGVSTLGERVKPYVDACVAELTPLGTGAAALYLVAFFFLPFLEVGVNHFSAWDAIAAVNQIQSAAGNQIASSGHGLIGLIGFIVALAPFSLPLLETRPRWRPAALLAPAVFMLLDALALYIDVQSSIHRAMATAQAMGGDSSLVSGMLHAIGKQVWAAISFGPGLYAMVVAAAYLAYLGVRMLPQRDAR